MKQKALITAEMLQELLNQNTLIRIVDARYLSPLPNHPTAYDTYLQGHIPGAVFFDLDRICDPHATLPHMLPNAKDFAEAVGKMGISHNHKIIIYDQQGFFSAPRVWWMFRVFGHQDIAILDGGVEAFLQTGVSLETDPPNYEAEDYEAVFHSEWVVDKEGVRDSKEDTIIVDARDTARYQAVMEEARPGLRSGHIPGAINVPWMSFKNKDTGRLLSDTELKEHLGSLVEEKDIISYCGSGVTACSLGFVLHLLGNEHVKIYDGSWAEWGALEEKEGYCIIKGEKP